MSLNEQIRQTAQRASDAELAHALETIQAHIRYREELRQNGTAGGRNARPPWAEPGRKRRGGHMNF
jgi:hypothetical protein